MEQVVLSKRDLIVFEIIEDFRNGRVSRQQAADILGLSERTITRKARLVREHGIEGLIHRNRGRLPHNKFQDEVREQFIELYKRKYQMFNFLHAFEFMTERNEISVSYSTFKNECRRRGLGKVRKRRSSKIRMARERAANEGFSWQLDGSPHCWNGKDTWSLIKLIDDATSKLPAAEFHPTETTWGCMRVVREAIEKYGLPNVIFTDRAGWSTGSTKRLQFSQFVRACDELGIKVIGLSSPEAKGRVERSFRTSQDRLVAELNFYGIKSMVDANRYLRQTYIPGWEERMSVEPASPVSRYRQVPADKDLNEIFCIKNPRVVNRDQTVQWQNRRFRIDKSQFGNLWKHEIAVHQYENGDFKFFYAGKELKFTEMKIPKRSWKLSA